MLVYLEIIASMGISANAEVPYIESGKVSSLCGLKKSLYECLPVMVTGSIDQNVTSRKLHFDQYCQCVMVHQDDSTNFSTWQ